MSMADIPAIGRPTGMMVKNFRGTVAVFTATIFLSAALLFSVQPMFAKMVLPKLGGSPSVWAVSMCFFQAVLLAGYCYAHVLNRCLTPRQAILTHIGILILASAAMPVTLPPGADQSPQGNFYLWLIGVLALGVGLPFFAVSANAPLLQSWFGRSQHPAAKDPYFLYAASNIGSLAALLSYPVLIEPFLGLNQQGELWSYGFLLLGVLIAQSGYLLLANAPDGNPLDWPQTAELAPPVSWRQRRLWIVLSFVPSALLVAFTTYISSDIASTPFLWVIPLAIFLLTFVLVFRDVPLIPHEVLLDRFALVAVLALFGTAAIGVMGYGIGFAGPLLAFVLACLVCHRELYLRRPETRNLTEFYLWMSVGGVFGGVFSAILAPFLFSTPFEFPLLIVAGLALRPAILDRRAENGEWRAALLILTLSIGALILVRLLVSWGVMEAHFKLPMILVAGLGFVMFLNRHSARQELAVAAAMLLVLQFAPAGSGAGLTERSFFGVHRVITTPEGDMRLLMHGTTTHGAERLREKDGSVVTHPIAATYYYPGSPMEKALALARAHHADGPLNAGIVGLGAGAMACNMRAGENLKYFEIDQSVVDIARNPSHFRYLARCRPEVPIVVGDARLTLVKEIDASIDYLLIDAFSSDAIPAHLMTIEAIRLYLSKLSEGGALVFHISNRHIDLRPVLASGLATLPGLEAVFVADPAETSGYDRSPSSVVIASRNPNMIAEARTWTGARPLKPSNLAPWSDDRNDVLTSLWRSWVK
jgi:spermidine synthase